MANKKLEITEQAFEKANRCSQKYESDLNREARRIARKDRGQDCAELTPSDYTKADRAIRDGVGRRTNYCSPLSSISLCIASVLLTEGFHGVWTRSEWWLVSTHSIMGFGAALVCVLAGIMLGVRAANA